MAKEKKGKDKGHATGPDSGEMVPLEPLEKLRKLERACGDCQQVIEPHPVFFGVPADFAHELGAVARGELAQAADRDHDIEHGHALAVGDRLRIRRLPDDANLFVKRALEPSDNDVYRR